MKKDNSLNIMPDSMADRMRQFDSYWVGDLGERIKEKHYRSKISKLAHAVNMKQVEIDALEAVLKAEGINPREHPVWSQQRELFYKMPLNLMVVKKYVWPWGKK